MPKTANFLYKWTRGFLARGATSAVTSMDRSGERDLALEPGIILWNSMSSQNAMTFRHCEIAGVIPIFMLN
jgi:hypothetical protein